jgi:hypothetical protein
VLRTLLLPVLLVLMWMRPMLLAAMALGVLLGSLPGSILHFYFVAPWLHPSFLFCNSYPGTGMLFLCQR